MKRQNTIRIDKDKFKKIIKAESLKEIEERELINLLTDILEADKDKKEWEFVKKNKKINIKKK